MVGRDERTGEILLSGVGQTHVEVIVEKLKRKLGWKSISLFRRFLQKTIRGTKKGVVYRDKKQTGGPGQFAEVHSMFRLFQGGRV